MSYEPTPKPSPTPRPLPRRLLGVWAHPDDECYLSAGLMARIAAAGGHVRLLCATRGEQGTGDPDLAGTTRFGALRELELRSSLALLGVDDLHVLGLPDGGCDAADDTALSATVAAHLAEIDADAVVTFGPDGITGHPDHLAVSRWATRAAPDRTEVLYGTMTEDFTARHRALHDRLGLFADLPGGEPAAVPVSGLALRVGLDHAELVRKRSALRAHGSQTAALAEMVGEATYFGWWRDECFRHPTEAERRATAQSRSARQIEVGS